MAAILVLREYRWPGGVLHYGYGWAAALDSLSGFESFHVDPDALVRVARQRVAANSQ